MFDIGWSELVLIGVVALIVVGPRDLPQMFRTLGRLTGKARMMARDFQRAMEDAADESGLKDISRDLNSIRSPLQTGLGSLNRKLDDWEAPKAKRAAPSPDAVAPEAGAPDPVVPDPVVPETALAPEAPPAAGWLGADAAPAVSDAVPQEAAVAAPPAMPHAALPATPPAAPPAPHPAADGTTA